MNRLEFMKQLARLLDDLPREEKIEILKYYNGYFDDAGMENEAEIIAQLGSPEKVATEVKAGMALDLEGEKAEEFDQEKCEQEKDAQEEFVRGEKSFTYGQATEQESSQEQTAYSYQDVSQPPIHHKKRNNWMTLAVIAILCVTFPVWIGLLGGLIGLIGGAIGLLVSVIVGLIGALVGLVGGVVGCIVGGIGMLLTAPITGMLSLAVGIFLLGLLLLLGLLVGLIFGKIVPGIIDGIGKLIRGVGKAVGGIFDGIRGKE